jgi:Fic family protein
VAFKPSFSITNRILNDIAKIEAAREVILSAPLIPKYEVSFRREAMARTVYHATHIEGNPLEAETVKRIVEKRGEEKGINLSGQAGGRERHFQEVINYRRVLEFIEAVVENRPSALKRRFGIEDLNVQQDNGQFVLSEDALKHLHRIVVDRLVPQAESGSYRQVAVVLRNSLTGEVSFHPPAWQDVSKQMRDFLEWLNSKESQQVHPVLRAGIVHYELARTHPFTEGNGRTARAAATLTFYQGGYDIKRFFSLEEYFDRDPNDYFGTLQVVSNQVVEDESKRDLTPWLEYFSQGVREAFEGVRAKVQRLSLDFRLKGELGKQIELSERQVKLIEFMETSGPLRNEDFRKVLPMVSEDTVRRDLSELIKEKLVVKKGKTKAARYRLSGH